MDLRTSAYSSQSFQLSRTKILPRIDHQSSFSFQTNRFFSCGQKNPNHFKNIKHFCTFLPATQFLRHLEATVPKPVHRRSPGQVYLLKIAVYIPLVSPPILWACPLSSVRTLTCTKTTVLASPASLGRQNEQLWHFRSANSDSNEGLDVVLLLSHKDVQNHLFYNDLCFWACYFAPLGISAHAAVSRLILWLEADRREQDLIHHGHKLHRHCQSLCFFLKDAERTWSGLMRKCGLEDGVGFCGFFRECPWTLERVSC